MKASIDHISNKRNSLFDAEKNNRDEIVVYNGYFTELKAALENGVEWTPEQLEQRQALEKERDFLLNRLDNKSNQVGGVRHIVDTIYNHVKALEEEIANIDKKTEEVLDQTKEYHKQSKEQSQKREDFEKQLFQLRTDLVVAEQELHKQKKILKIDEDNLKELDQSLEFLKAQMEVYLKDYDLLYKTLTDATIELEKQKSQNRKIEEDIQVKLKYIAEKEVDSEGYQKQIVKLQQLCEVARVKTIESDAERVGLEKKRNDLQDKLKGLRENDAVTVRKEIESVEKQLTSLRIESELIRKKQIGSERAARTMQDLIQINLNGKRNLSGEKKLLEEDIENQKDQIRLLLIEKERYEHEADITNQQYYTALEELKLQELQLQELQNKIISDQNKLKQKQNLYEAVRSDRNLYSKQLVDSQEEINILKRKFRGMNHRIDQLKDEISVKDHSIVKEHFLHHSVDKERELVKNELTKIKKQVHSSESIIENQRVEILKLSRIIEEAELERQRQKNELAAVLSERNLLTSQVVKRNYELGVLYERIKIQRSNLRIGERSYNRVVESLGDWQKQLIAIVKEHTDTINSLSGIEDLRCHVIRLERELLTEQTKSRALLDELAQPMNVHRWRVLESSDPKRFEKITQIQSLQKQLINKSDDITRNDLLIQEKEKVYSELKSIIARQPGPEVEEQILVYQQTLKDKNKQLNSMNEELSMYRQQVSSFKEQLSEIDYQMTKTKKKWFKTKKDSAKFQ